MSGVELRDQIERGIEDAVAAAMNARHPQLRGLWWTATGQRGTTRCVSGHPRYDVPEGGAARVLAVEWAQALGLDQVEAASSGIVQYAGDVDGVDVTVWAIVDPDAWMGRTRVDDEHRRPFRLRPSASDGAGLVLGPEGDEDQADSADEVDNVNFAPAGECPGCVGRGTGTVCYACGLPIPLPWRRTEESPSDYRPDCAGCRAGRVHHHGDGPRGVRS